MRAAHVHTCGEPPRPVEAAEPVAGEGQALVAVTAVPITPLDLLCAGGTSYFGEPATPYVPGVQGVGVVRTSARLAAGTRVWFPTSAGMAPGDGGMAELAVVADGDLVPVSGAVPDEQLAALGLSAIAAWTALLLRGGLQPGERVLVLGSSGVVGTVALQAARLQGASAVYGAAVEPAARARALELGADGFVQLERDDDVEGLAARLREVVGEVDVVLDPLCGVPASAAALCLAPRGRLVNLGSSAGATATFSSAHLRSGSREVRGYTNNDLTAEQRRAALAALEEHAEAGRIVVPHEVFALADVAEAWTRQARGEVRGRAVVRLG
ncbi:quinone oxidoreductase family protein [Nocardioides lianchengensis]|uniref:NADPH:quinone reductase n=1 Tax=Nocardioides lianchengensis TaxID=1045774 RepID=A0A1G6JB58_9ACTN|nr:zinc-binding alcohol dehydrogenase family protein [Nocardioides lianchengensis]NYG12798.1 NADPH:quinone reductase-like Zn-dependent oxidoreductase [Nocardioides lianchengensis]SDC15909.1 NADPH:quinone reductase [Nocardioides lianchengensis]